MPGTATAALRAALNERRPELAARLDAMARDAQRLLAVRVLCQRCSAPTGRASGSSSRLGLEANDVLDEFLNLALAYESRETPSLQGFVAWLRTASAEIKRDMEIARDEVRVMTVHGAKGLEAPIVILADTTTEPQGPIQHQPRLLPLPAQDAAPGTPDRLVWMPTKKDDTAPIAARARPRSSDAVDEYRRLLYVAMTRAADRLVICGSDRREAGGRTAAGTISIAEALEAALQRGAGRRRRRHRAALSQDAGEAGDAVAVRSAAGAAGGAANVPDWLTRDARRARTRRSRRSRRRSL